MVYTKASTLSQNINQNHFAIGRSKGTFKLANYSMEMVESNEKKVMIDNDFQMCTLPRKGWTSRQPANHYQRDDLTASQRHVSFAPAETDFLFCLAHDASVQITCSNNLKTRENF